MALWIFAMVSLVMTIVGHPEHTSSKTEVKLHLNSAADFFTLNTTEKIHLKCKSNSFICIGFKTFYKERLEYIYLIFQEISQFDCFS